MSPYVLQVQELSNRAELTIAYDGEALRGHLIDVRDLAPALLGIGQLFEEANRALNGERAQVSVLVKANGQGSFEVVLEVLQSVGRQLESILTGDHVESAINLKEVLGMTGGGALGLFKLLKWLRGRKPAVSKEKALPGHVKLVVDGEILEVPAKALRLFQDVGVRDASMKVLEPLSRPGISTFEVREGAVPVVSIESSEREWFALPAQEPEALPPRTWTQAFTIVSLSFKDDNKWRLTDGTTTIAATIRDDGFKAEIDSGRTVFMKGDMLLCLVRAVQTYGPDGLRSDYEVLQVLEHRRRATQIPLRGVNGDEH